MYFYPMETPLHQIMVKTPFGSSFFIKKGLNENNLRNFFHKCSWMIFKAYIPFPDDLDFIEVRFRCNEI